MRVGCKSALLAGVILAALSMAGPAVADPVPPSGGLLGVNLNAQTQVAGGWGTGTGSKVPDLPSYQNPINESCRHRGEACKTACQVSKDGTTAKCVQACLEAFRQKCGTANQVPANFAPGAGAGAAKPGPRSGCPSR